MPDLATVTFEEVFDLCPVCQGAATVAGIACEYCDGTGGQRIGWRRPCATCANSGAVRAQVPTPLAPASDPIMTESVCPDCAGWSKHVWMVCVVRAAPQAPGLFEVIRTYTDEPSLPAS